MKNIKHATSYRNALAICSWYLFVPYKHKDTDNSISWNFHKNHIMSLFLIISGTLLRMFLKGRTCILIQKSSSGCTHLRIRIHPHIPPP